MKFEKEEQERLERQRIEEEKWHQLEEKDLERRTQELEELYLLEMCFPEAEKLKQETRSLSRWMHYLACDGNPDPSESQEMNSFISLWREELNQSFEAVMEKSKLVLYLIEKMKLMLLETPRCDLGNKTTMQYKGMILELQELLHFKLNRATELLLRQSSNLADVDSGNMEKTIRDENINVYLWANLKKNPRHKSVRFPSTQMGLEIPRILATSDIALRLLHTSYDHISPVLPTLEPEEEEPAPAEPVKEEAEAPETEKPEVEEAEGSANELVELTQEEAKDGEEQEKEEGQMIFLEEDTLDEAKQYELEMKLLSDKVLEAQEFLVKNASEKPDVTHSADVDLCQFMMVGGVFHLDILHLPPLCKSVKGWMMVELPKGGLQNFTYPPENVEDVDPENVFPPIEVTLEVPEHVVFFEEPVVVRWDAEDQCWKKDAISDVYYREEEKLLSFSLEMPCPISLAQDLHVNMPYVTWELTPLDLNKALLTVTTVFTEFQIQIKENLCLLSSIKLKDPRPFSTLEGKWMAPIPFIIALKRAGLNIFPTRYACFYVTDNQKVREQVTSKSDSSAWALLMFSGDRAQKLKLTEESEAFSETVEEGTEFHSSLYHMVKDFASQEAMERIRNSTCQYVDSVCHLLLSTRVLNFA
ncbi:dynein axonemal intermediate chain 7 isoform 2-T2 [Thomomys bottae]